MEDNVIVEIRKDAEILKVDAVHNKPFIWARVPNIEGYETEKRSFAIIGTGREIGNHQKYIGTFFTHEGALVWHLHENLK